IPEPNGAGLPDAVGARDEVHLLDEPVEPVVEADAVEQASLDDPRAVDEPRPGDEVLAHHVHAVVEAEMAAGAVELELADRRAELDTVLARLAAAELGLDEVHPAEHVADSRSQDSVVAVAVEGGPVGVEDPREGVPAEVAPQARHVEERVLAEGLIER